MLNAATYEVPIDFEVVAGAIGDRVLQADPTLGPPYVEAGIKLTRRSARVITGNCRFAVAYEPAVRAAVVDRPVFRRSVSCPQSRRNPAR
jgi:hypothetical protein